MSGMLSEVMPERETYTVQGKEREGMQGCNKTGEKHTQQGKYLRKYRDRSAGHHQHFSIPWQTTERAWEMKSQAEVRLWKPHVSLYDAWTLRWFEEGSQSHLLLREDSKCYKRNEFEGHTNKWREMNLKALLTEKNKGDAGLNWGSISKNIQDRKFSESRRNKSLWNE